MIAATPIQIGSKTIKNRITFAPTVKFDFTDDTGLVTQKHIDHYTERAIYHLSQRGVKFDLDSKNVKNGKTVACYMADEIAGFAFHLVQA